MAGRTEVEWVHDIPGQHMHKGVMYFKPQTTELLDSLPDFKFSPEDVMVATYPKSGTTWMCELADAVVHDGDTSMVARAPINKRWPFLETSFYGNCLDKMANAPRPRLIRTHMQVQYFEKQVREQGVKTIVVTRNPKDALVSYYHMYRMSRLHNQFNGSWDEFFHIVKADQLQYGNWFDFVLGWWTVRHLPNVIRFNYEDMLADPKNAVERLATFMGKTFDQEVVDRIVHHVSFDEMKKNPNTNFSNSLAFDIKIMPFMRKGMVGDWKNYFSGEQSEYIDNLVKERIEGTGIEISYEGPISGKTDISSL